MAGTCSNILKVRASDEVALKGFDEYINGLNDIRGYICQLESGGIPQDCIEKIDEQEHNINSNFHWWVGESRPPIDEAVLYSCGDLMVDG